MPWSSPSSMPLTLNSLKLCAFDSTHPHLCLDVFLCVTFQVLLPLPLVCLASVNGWSMSAVTSADVLAAAAAAWLDESLASTTMTRYDNPPCT